jgi:hypothetical protein
MFLSFVSDPGPDIVISTLTVALVFLVDFPLIFEHGFKAGVMIEGVSMTIYTFFVISILGMIVTYVV